MKTLPLILIACVLASCGMPMSVHYISPDTGNAYSYSSKGGLDVRLQSLNSQPQRGRRIRDSEVRGSTPLTATNLP